MNKRQRRLTQLLLLLLMIVCVIVLLQRATIRAAIDYRSGAICTQAMTKAIHFPTGAIHTFSNGCLPPGWSEI